MNQRCPYHFHDAAMKLLRPVLQNHRLLSLMQVLGTRLLAVAVNLGTGILSARMLGPHGRGVLTAMLLGSQVMAGISCLGLHDSLIYNTKADPGHERQLITCALLIAMGAGLLGVAIGGAFIPVFLQKYDASTIFVGSLLMAVVPICAVSYVLIAVLEGHGRFGVVSYLGVAGPLATLVALPSLWILGALTPATAAAAYALPSVPICLLLWLFARQVSQLVSQISVGHLRRIFNYALRCYGVDICGTIGGWLDQLILILFLDPRHVGFYAIATNSSRVLSLISASVATVMFPSVAGRPKGAVVEIVGVAARASSILTGGAALGLALLAPYLLTLLYGIKFEEAVAPFRWLLAYYSVNGVVSILYLMFSAVGWPGIVTVFESIGIAVSGVCMLVLVPQIGTVGSALSLLIAAILKMLCVLVGLPFILKMPLPRLVPNKGDVLRVFLGSEARWRQ